MLLLTRLAFAEPEMIPEDSWAKANETALPAVAELDLQLKGGGTFKLSEQKGKKVLLSFWASWCSPCRRELPALAEWSKAHPDVKVIAVNVDRTPDDAAKFLQSVAFALPVAFDPSAEQVGKFGVTSMPTMFLFDGAGALVWNHVGYSEEKKFSELETALAGAR